MSQDSVKEEMPFCPKCDSGPVVFSSVPENGTHYCYGCGDWFNYLCSVKRTKQSTTNASKAETKELPEDEEYQFRREFEERFPSIDFEFVVLMDEIGKLGRDKYKENAIEMRIKRGNFDRDMERIHRTEIQRHAAEHFRQYTEGIRHDIYGTTKHQLGAAAFNPMMEFMLSKETN